MSKVDRLIRDRPLEAVITYPSTKAPVVRHVDERALAPR
jgi:hypothetical protein